MSDHIFLGKSYETLKKNKKSSPYSKVVIITGDRNEDDEDITYVAGDDTGATLEIQNPYGTQAMAEAILSSIRGFRYQPFELTNGLLNPAAEIGDSLTAGTLYSGIFSLNQDYGLLLTSDIAAKKNDEEDEEFKVVPKSTRTLTRTLSQLKTSLKVQQNLIEARITYDDAETLIQQDISQITLSATNGSDSSTLTLRAGEATLSSANISFSGVVTFTDLSTAGSTTINGANITTGTISADRIATNISQVNNYLTLGVAGSAARLAFPPDTTTGFGAYIEHTGSGLDIHGYDNVTIHSDYTVYLDSRYGLVMDDGGATYNVLWGTASPDTVFNAAGIIPPEAGQIYFMIN